MSKTRMAAVCLVITLLASVFPVTPAAAVEPMDNPGTAPVTYYSVALLQKYSQAVGLVTSGDISSLERLRDQSGFANVPPELKVTLDNLLSSCIDVAALVPQLQSELEYAQTLQAQYRIVDSKPILNDAKDKLTQAYAGLLVMDGAAVETGRYWKVATLKENNSLNATYFDVRSQLQNVRNLLDLFNNMYSSLAQTKPDSSLRSSNLSLVINPDTAFVGDNITIRGILSSNGAPLGSRNVTILVDNTPAGSVVTGTAGDYETKITVPFKYIKKMNLQAVFYPAGHDIGQYLGVSSRLAGLNVLFYPTALRASQGTPANPGRDFLVTAVFSYNGSPAPDRNLSVYLDGKSVFEGMTGQTAFLRLPVAANTSPGAYNLSFYAPPSGRYAPAAYSMPVEVNLAVPVIEVDTQRILFLPFSREINGKISSTAGPLKNAGVTISLGSWQAAAVTREEGSFTARLDTGLSPALLGRQTMRIAVTPQEPWNKAGSLDIPIIVVNPVSIAGIMLILTLALWLFLRGRRVRVFAPTFAPVPAPPDLAAGVTKAGHNPGSTLVNLYQAVLTLVQAAAGLMLQSHQTLSEFATEAGPKLGRLAAYFQEFTKIIERHLYSKHTSATDTERAKELRRTLLTGIKHENP